MTHDPLPPLTPEEGGLHGEIPDTPEMRAWFQGLGERTNAMTHDPMCPLESECPGRDRPHFIVEGDHWCGGCQIECQCILITKVRTDEREQESARRTAKFGYWHDYRPEMP